MNGGQVSHENDPDNALERKELEGVERLVKDAAHEGEIANCALEKEGEDLAEANWELEALKRSRLVTIIVDGTPHEVPKKERITYVEVVTLAYPDYPRHPEKTYSVTYTHGPSRKSRGNPAARRKREDQGGDGVPC